MLGALCSYSTAFLREILLMCSITQDYLPVYIQACLGTSPVRAGILLLGYTCLAPVSGILSGISVNKLHLYRPQLWISWSIILISLGLLVTLGVNSSQADVVGFALLLAVGIGGLNATTMFPVLAPLSVEMNAQALAFFAFLRNFAQVRIYSSTQTLRCYNLFILLA